MDEQTKVMTGRVKAAPDGSVSALFCRFDVVDLDGDVILASAFKQGQGVPMAWAHNWNQIVGRGSIRVMTDGAHFDGKFFLNTSAGKEAYETVKAMSDLMEWSWGFKPTQVSYRRDPNTDQAVRVIARAEVFEVSPVLKGAGIGTRTVALKSPSRGRVPLSEVLALYAQFLGICNDLDG